MPLKPKPILKSHQPDSDPSVQPSPAPLPYAYCTSATVRRDVLSPHVHFPPTPVLVEEHRTHSPSTYDRAPIEVAQNACALPERHERDYGSPSITLPRKAVKGSYFHPRAFEACTTEPASSSPPPVLETPPLVPDLSASESSDDPDGLALTPPQYASPPISSHFGKAPAVLALSPRSPTPRDINNAMSFLPHSPSPPRERDRAARARERPPPRPARPRKQGRSTSGSRTPSGTRTPSSLRKSSLFAPDVDDGCLGGF